MKLNFALKHSFSALAFAAALVLPLSASAQAIDGPVTIVVPSDPGSAPDVLARILTAPMSERIGHPVVVENRPGAGGNIGALAVAKA